LLSNSEVRLPLTPLDGGRERILDDVLRNGGLLDY
jgi:hypothetical protein